MQVPRLTSKILRSFARLSRRTLSIPRNALPTVTRGLSSCPHSNSSCGEKCGSACSDCHKLTQCWNCHHFTECTSRFCPMCHKIQPVYSLEEGGCNYFQLFGLPETYDINLSKLESSFKNLQKVIHPDLYSTKSEEEKRVSANVSSVLNTAHNKLKNPVSRAAYLVKLYTGKDVLGEEENYKVPMDLLMEVMEIREALSNVKTKEEKEKLQEEATKAFKQHEDAFRCSLCKHQVEACCEEAVAMKYYDSVLQEINNLTLE